MSTDSHLHMELCRLCTESVNPAEVRNLFDDAQRKKLWQILQLTGLKLKNSPKLPEYICQCCTLDLERAYRFRELCLKSQLFFRSAEYKWKLIERRQSDYKILQVEQMAPIERIELPEAEKFIKKEEEEEEVDLFESEFLLTSDVVGEEHSNESSDLYNHLTLEFTGGSETMLTKVAAATIPISATPHQPSPVAAKKSVSSDSNTSMSGFSKKRRKRRSYEKPPKTFVCDQCGNTFTARQHFETHMRRHNGDKQYQCEVCPDKFLTQSQLNRHMRRHTGERPFVCQYCGRRFTDYSTRVKHERTHTNERPFSCNQCAKAFTTSYILKNHMLTHTGERSFKCSLCNKAFQRQTNLDVHCRSITHQQNLAKSLQLKTDEATNAQ